MGFSYRVTGIVYTLSYNLKPLSQTSHSSSSNPLSRINRSFYSIPLSRINPWSLLYASLYSIGIIGVMLAAHSRLKFLPPTQTQAERQLGLLPANICAWYSGHLGGFRVPWCLFWDPTRASLIRSCSRSLSAAVPPCCSG